MNIRFNALDASVLNLHSVGLLVGFGKHAMKRNGRPLSIMAHLKSSIVGVKTTENCLAYAL